MEAFTHNNEHLVDLRGVRTEAMVRRQEAVQRNALDLRERNREELRERREERPAARTGTPAWNDIASGIFRVASIMLVVSASWTYLPSIAASLAYFTDTEGSQANVMASGLLDLTVTDPEAEIVSCGGMAVASTTLSTNSTGFDALVSASTTALEGYAPLCEALTLDVRYDSDGGSETIYSGPLGGFTATDIGTGTLRYIADLPAGEGPFPDGAFCTMDIEFTAWLSCVPDPLQSGFTDVEHSQVTFVADTSSCEQGECEPCQTCGDLYVNIHNDNDSTIIHDVQEESDTGGNTANGGNGGEGESGGEGGTVVTGDASTSVTIHNEVNTNTTIIETNCSCGSGCTCPKPCEQHGEETCGEEVDGSTGESVGDETTVVDEETEGNSEVTGDAPPTPTPEELLAQIQAALDAKLAKLHR